MDERGSLPQAPLGRSGLEVTRLGLGTAPLGELFVRMTDEEAQATLEAAYDAGITLFDTAPYYGLGLSEHRVGRFVRGVDRDRVIVATKIGRLLSPVARGQTRENTFWAGGLNFDARYDYGYDGVLRAHEDSLQRLGLDRVDLLAIHDLDLHHFTETELDERLRELAGGGARALEELRAGGVIAAVGLGINRLGSIPRVLEVIDLDYAIVAMPYTLLDQDALTEELPLCLERGVGVLIGAVFASGILAAEGEDGTYGYDRAPDDVADKARRMHALCKAHGVSLTAAALQFPLAHPAVAAVIPGALSAAQVRENVEHATTPIPSQLWADLKEEGLLREDAPVPD